MEQENFELSEADARWQLALQPLVVKLDADISAIDSNAAFLVLVATPEGFHSMGNMSPEMALRVCEELVEALKQMPADQLAEQAGTTGMH